eukprot:CAMPEP_0183371622 /NCGR_PEP_ID=MMETSP0164_2-20130417/105956_1 /TAXON_ID=221442 /ORGANISM="Coccolithus pelagicus ssp braarudi, Strain PLY182g" /LENGTH=49 /DNA_ID= /DNA_START= /DNA_END= /DNA_ORIENTATION=
MTLKDFCDLLLVKEAKLSKVEVAAIRLYTGPLFRPINLAMRTQQVHAWA